MDATTTARCYSLPTSPPMPDAPILRPARVAECKPASGGPVGSRSVPLDETRSPVFVGRSTAARTIQAAVAALAHVDLPFLVRGETGSGARDVAAAIHRQSRRAGQRFTAIVLDGLNQAHIERQFLGTDCRPGLLASHGTLYIENIEALSPRMQSELAQILAAPRSTVARIIAGTSVTLEEYVRVGRFRYDLATQLAVTVLNLPPLRARHEDLGAIAECCITLWAEHTGAQPVILTEAALTHLCTYTWPENLLELERTIARACTFARGRPITVACIRMVLGARPRRNAALDVIPLRQIERVYLLNALERCGWNQSLAARRLRVSRNTLIRKMHIFEIVPPARPADLQRPVTTRHAVAQ